MMRVCVKNAQMKIQQLCIKCLYKVPQILDKSSVYAYTIMLQ